MVNKNNTRVMVTLSKETERIVDDVAKTYGLSRSAAISMMIVVFHNSTLRKER